MAVLTTLLTAATAVGSGTGYWHTSGNQILDSNNNVVRITGVNWYGFETTDQVVHGLYAQDYKTILTTIKNLGFNVVRIPFSNQMVEAPAVPSNISYSGISGKINTDLSGLNALQVLDKIILEAGTLGLHAILDNHRSEAGNSNESSGLWYTSAYPQTNWVQDWQTLAIRYSANTFTVNGNPTVIGMDLRNEPHLIGNTGTSGACWTGDTATNGCPTTNTGQNWPVAAQAAGNAILAINPHLLIIVEGNDCYSNLCAWQGENLLGVAKYPVVLTVSNQLVYSAHDYGPQLYRQPWFNSSTMTASLNAIWSQFWGYISAAGTAPVWLGEFGTDQNAPDIQSASPGSQGQWFQTLVAYLQNNPAISWTYWALNGEDSYGLLDSNYDAAPASSLKQNLLASIQFNGTNTPSPSFTLSTSSASASVTQGNSTTQGISVNTTGGFNGNVTLSASGLPSGVTASFSANPAAGSSVLTLTATGSASTGTSSVTITGVSGSLSASSAISLTVSAPSSRGATVMHVANPFAGATQYLNPDYAAEVQTAIATQPSGSMLAKQMATVASYPTAIWMDHIGAIAGGASNGGRLSLAQHISAALSQQVASQPVVMTIVIYDLPQRDCAALASNGELSIAANPPAQPLTGIETYQQNYITPIYNILQPYAANPNIRFVLIVEPDSLPNLVTNTGLSSTLAACVAANGGQSGSASLNSIYVHGIQYALNKFHPLPNVYQYLDIGQSAWLGWPANLSPAISLYTGVVKGTTASFASVDGFISNTANYVPTKEPFLTATAQVGGNPVESANFFQYDPEIDEADYAAAFYSKLVSAGFPSTIGFLIDTSRNGWGGPYRPTAASTSTNLNTFVNASKIDQRSARGNWCNQAYAGLGEPPATNPSGYFAQLQAFVWIKPPGESDGTYAGSALYTGGNADENCDPAHNNALANNAITQALPNSPPAGTFWPVEFTILLQNAYPVVPAGAVTNTAGFSLGASSADVVPGSSTTDTVTVSPFNGFAGAVTLSASGLPAGVTASFSPATVGGSNSSILTLAASSAAAAGATTVTVTGKSGAITASAAFTLTVSSATAAPVAAVSAAASSLSVTQGAAVTDSITVSGFSSAVTLLATGLPSGVTASFSTNPATSTSTLTLTASTSASIGPATITITGTAGAQTASTTINLAVNAPAGTSTCSTFGAIPINSGYYIFQNNEWNSTAPQCATVSGAGFTLTTANFNLPNGGAPATYPSIFWGCHWGACTSGSSLPIQESALASANSSVTITQPSGYNSDSAYDIWFNQTPTTSGQPNGTEVMIWIDHQGFPQPFGSQVGTVTIDGMTWAVWTGRQSSWNIVSYVATTPVTTASNLNLLPFFNYATTLSVNGSQVLSPSWYLIDIEFGFEVWTGGQGLAVSNFSASASSLPVVTSPPSITSLNSASGAAGSTVIITGTNFGASQASSTVSFGSATASVSSWSNTSISAIVPSLSAGAVNVVVNVGGVSSNASNFMVTATCSTGTGTTSSTVGSGYWHTSGNQIIDANGNFVRIAGINWYGFETTDYIAHGLWAKDYKSIINTIKNLGYNVIRIPFSNQMVETNPIPTNYTSYANGAAANTALVGQTALQDLDTIISYAGSVGLRVILDNHRSEAGNSNEASGLWYTSAYPQTNWVQDWQNLATRYSASTFTFNGNPAVIGMDLRNEPHLNGTSGACWTGDSATSGCPTTNTAQNWPVAAQTAGNAILAINPHLLVIVEGNDCYSSVCGWQGGNLLGVAKYPVVLKVPNQLVYSAHDYGPQLYQQPWFNSSTTTASLNAIWNQFWGYISAAGTAPVWLGEFGTSNTSTDIQNATPGSQGQWFQTMASYLKANTAISWSYWALNGEDSYGLFDSNYDSTPASALKQSLLAQVQFPLGGAGTTFSAGFSLAPTAGSLTMTAGSSVTDTITVTGVNCFSGSVTLAASGLPSGVNASFGTNPTTGASVLTLTASSTAATGTSTITITGTSGALISSTNVSLTVHAVQQPSFTLTASPSSLTVIQGSNTSSTIVVSGAGGFSGTVSLNASGLPSGVTASFLPSSTSGSSVLTLTAGATAAPGVATVTIAGTSGSISASTNIKLTINPAPTPSFKLSASASSLSITQGSSGASTITITGAGGFTGSVTLAATGLPSGVTASFSANPTTGASLLTLAATAAATTGTSTVTIAGTSGSLNASTTIALTLNPTVQSAFACHVNYIISNSWPGGFQVNPVIYNTGTTAISNWTLKWTFSNGQVVSGLWNGSVAQSGANVTVTSLSYNGSIPAGGNYNGIGFNGTLSGMVNAIPTSFTVNGTTCK